MSGPLGSQQWMYSTGFYPYEIDQSLRFNDDDSAYLNRTPASAGNRKTWTWSGWVKRGNLGTAQHIFEGASGATDIVTFLRFGSDDKIRFASYNSGYQFQLDTSAVFRDTSAWYHIVAHLDTTQATSSNRAKIYINGEQVTSFSTASYPALNHDSYVNITDHHFIGKWNINGTRQFDGYMAEVNFIDGQALDPTSFGEFKSGVWIPKSYSGSYGTNGFYLDFGNSGSLGADSSGNGNNWTPNNLAATDQVLDSPTNNFATLNPLSTTSYTGNKANTISEGNLLVAHTAAFYAGSVSTIAIPKTGKWYGECYAKSAVGAGDGAWFGMHTLDTNNAYYYDGYNTGTGYLVKKTDGSYVSETTGVGAVVTGDVLSILVDADARTAQIKRNNTNVFTSYTMTSSEVDYLISYVGYEHTGGGYLYNFGQDSSFAGNKTAQGNTDANGIGDFYYAPPAGYLALCTANLPDPAIDPAQDDVPADYFNTVLYTATGNDNLAITGVGFQPDFTWIKSRSAAYSHNVYDAVRGVSKRLQTNLTNAESSPISGVKSFDADGFTLGNDTNDTNFTSGVTYASWNWLAGNGTTSNTDGTITSTVSANQKAGFSIFTFTGNGDGETVGHGLGAVPNLVIIKARNTVMSWAVRTNAIDGTSDVLFLDMTDAKSDSGTAYPDATVITAAGTTAGGTVGENYVAYAFVSVEGFSKIGSYTGNGSSDGPFVYTGFRPAFVMFKRTDSTSNWIIFDQERGLYNLNDNYLYPNSSAAEGTSASSGVDLLSNGFKQRNTYADANTSGGTYIFMAFAEMPTKYSLGA